MDSCLRLHVGGLCAGMTEGMGPRIRGDNGGEGERWVEARRDGGGNGRFANRPYQMVVRGNEGWVPAPRLHGGKISTRGQGEGMGARAGLKPAPTELIAMWA